LPQHNAVVVRVADAAAEAASKAMAAVAGVAKVETASKAGGQTLLRAIVTGGKPLSGAIAEALRSGSIVADEIYLERGRLDDVFRQITSFDKGARHV